MAVNSVRRFILCDANVAPSVLPSNARAAPLASHVLHSTTYADAGVMIIPKKVSSPSFFVGVDLVISVCEILFVYMNIKI